MSDETNVTADSNVQSVSTGLIIWCVLVVLYSGFMIFNSNAPQPSDTSFFVELLAMIGASVLGIVAIGIADMLRRFVAPSAVYTSGGFFSLLGIKLFWLIGPQCIALFVGPPIGASIVFMLFGIEVSK